MSNKNSEEVNVEVLKELVDAMQNNRKFYHRYLIPVECMSFQTHCVLCGGTIFKEDTAIRIKKTSSVDKNNVHPNCLMREENVPPFYNVAHVITNDYDSVNIEYDSSFYNPSYGDIDSLKFNTGIGRIFYDRDNYVWKLDISIIRNMTIDMQELSKIKQKIDETHFVLRRLNLPIL